MRTISLATLLLALLLSGCASSPPTNSVQETSTSTKQEWAARVVAAQQGPELERLSNQIATSTTQDLIARWKPQFDARVSKPKLAEATQAVDAQLQKYNTDIQQLVSSQAKPISTEVLTPVYMTNFSLDELKQLAAFFESPTVKKYQTLAPEWGSTFVQKLVESVQPQVQARTQEFDAVVSKIIGPGPSKKTPAKK